MRYRACEKNGSIKLFLLWFQSYTKNRPKSPMRQERRSIVSLLLPCDELETTITAQGSSVDAFFPILLAH